MARAAKLTRKVITNSTRPLAIRALTDFPLASAWVGARTLRLADGPDEVHRNVIAKIELGKHAS